MAFNRNTFTKLVEYGRNRLMQSGTLAYRMAIVVNGLLPDSLAEGARLASRWTMPLPDTPLDAIPHLLRRFGLPHYSESYITTLERIQDAWATHNFAGAKVMLIAEAVRCGLVNPTIPTPADVYTWQIDADGLAGPVSYGTFTWGDGSTFDTQLPAAVGNNVHRMLKYFRPAGARFLGVNAP